MQITGVSSGVSTNGNALDDFDAVDVNNPPASAVLASSAQNTEEAHGLALSWDHFEQAIQETNSSKTQAEKAASISTVQDALAPVINAWYTVGKEKALYDALIAHRHEISQDKKKYLPHQEGVDCFETVTGCKDTRVNKLLNMSYMRADQDRSLDKRDVSKVKGPIVAIVAQYPGMLQEREFLKTLYAQDGKISTLLCLEPTGIGKPDYFSANKIISPESPKRNGVFDHVSVNPIQKEGMQLEELPFKRCELWIKDTEKHSEKTVVVPMAYTEEWPTDRNISAETLIAIGKYLNEAKDKSGGYPLIHCSDGVYRSGEVLITMRLLDSKDKASLERCIKDAQNQRHPAMGFLNDAELDRLKKIAQICGKPFIQSDEEKVQVIEVDDSISRSSAGCLKRMHNCAASVARVICKHAEDSEVSSNASDLEHASTIVNQLEVAALARQFEEASNGSLEAPVETLLKIRSQVITPDNDSTNALASVKNNVAQDKKDLATEETYLDLPDPTLRMSVQAFLEGEINAMKEAAQKKLSDSSKKSVEPESKPVDRVSYSNTRNDAGWAIDTEGRQGVVMLHASSPSASPTSSPVVKQEESAVLDKALHTALKNKSVEALPLAAVVPSEQQQYLFSEGDGGTKRSPEPMRRDSQKENYKKANNKTGDVGKQRTQSVVGQAPSISELYKIIGQASSDPKVIGAASSGSSNPDWKPTHKRHGTK